MEQPLVPVPEEHSQRFTELAQGARLMWRMHSQVEAPMPDSNFARVAELYPFESIALHSRGYIDAAFEHLLLWSDQVAPLKFHPEQITAFNLRPCFTLARAALESASQAVWLLSTTDPMECVRRHLSLMRWDLDEKAKWHADAVAKAAVRAEDAALVARVAGVFTEAQIRPSSSYLTVLHQACKENDSLGLAGADVERIWRAASGAAHGKQWPNNELRRPAATAPDELSTMLFPDTAAMVEVLETAHQMTQIAALSHAAYSGADIQQLLGHAWDWLAGAITLKEGAVPLAAADLLSLVQQSKTTGELS